MGRLRNISASFKAAAFPTAATLSSTSDSTSQPEGTEGAQGKKESAVIRETTSNSILNASSAAQTNPMVYTPPTIRPANEDIEELKPVFSYLSSHSNKLYQEGYFLKLDDLDTNGRPQPQRDWTECFAQLVGTILSFWDAAALDAAGQDGEVAPSFINLADASIKMIETLPTRNQNVQPLQNVLSISTAGKNRYLLHFNSLHSLTQWTAGIRLAMFENASLQELYTGSLIAGKGKQLNGINQIMTKNRFRIEDWARVRFGAGTPWRRCWCVIEPPDEKEWQKSQRRLGKRSAYEKVVYPKGDIKFYDTKKIKKALPIATITDAYSAYALYPQSKALINESTLVKLEGKITIHSQPESKTEGFVFVMPEVHPAVSGFETMLRWLLPVYDTFSLYGRPNRLVPDTLDTRSLMFAMPKERRYGYLDIIDISTLIHTEGSDKWTEREWRKRMKEAVSRRMSMQLQGRASNAEGARNSGNPRQAIQFSDSASIHSNSSHRRTESGAAAFETPKKTHTAPAQIGTSYHARSVSENTSLTPMKTRGAPPREYTPTSLSEEYSPPQSQQYLQAQMPQQRHPLRPRVNEAGYVDSANSSDSEIQGHINAEDVGHDMIQQRPVQPVVAPPSFNHQPNEQPKKRPADRPELRREKSRMSDSTLSQMNPRVLEELRQSAARGEHNTQGGGAASVAAMHAWRQNGDQSQIRGVNETPADKNEILANSQRPAVVTNLSSTSLHSSIRRKPVPTATSKSTEHLRPHNPRQYSETSNYSMPDHDRGSSPDYTSQASQEQAPERSKARGGTRKIIGDPDAGKVDVEPLQIDFGPTQRLTTESSDSTVGRPTTATGRRSPFDSLGTPGLHSNPASSPTHTPETQSPRDRPSHSRSPSYAWQPGSQVAAGEDGLSAEEFVKQRAAIASRPKGYLPRRTQSSGRIEQIKNDNRPESPQSPQSPQSKSPRKLQKRTPSSRNSSGNSVDYSAYLSAREQEHVAKMTGGPLLNVNSSPNRMPDPNVGLIGAISAREQERRNIKDGVQGHMVQAAIDQREREARARQMQQAAHQRTPSQNLLLQPSQSMGQIPYSSQQSAGPYDYYGPRPTSTPTSNQTYWNQMQSQYPQPNQQWRPQQPESMYGVQQQQQSRTFQGGDMRPDMGTQLGYPLQQQPQRQLLHQQSAPSMHARSQSGYSQYGGYYAPRR